MWDVAHRAPEESWIDYCQRALDESLREIETARFEDVIPLQGRDCVYISPTYVEEFDINSLVPRNKHDRKRAAAAIAAGYPAVAPVLPEMLEWLQDMNWPVAQDLAP